MARLTGGTNSGNYGEKTFVSKACEYFKKVPAAHQLPLPPHS